MIQPLIEFYALINKLILADFLQFVDIIEVNKWVLAAERKMGDCCEEELVRE